MASIYVFTDAAGARHALSADLIQPRGLWDGGRQVRLSFHALNQTKQRFDLSDYAAASEFLAHEWRTKRPDAHGAWYEHEGHHQVWWVCPRAVLTVSDEGAFSTVVTAWPIKRAREIECERERARRENGGAA